MFGPTVSAADEVETLLRSRFGLAEFRPGQREVIDALCTRNAALAVLPTGGGKSLCYQLPALLFTGVTLVVSPLIALMKDQIDYLRRRGIAAARLDSSLETAELLEVGDQLRCGTLQLLYVAPERFKNERFLADLRPRYSGYRPVRGGRSALHLGVGPQLPPGLPQAGRNGARAWRRAHPGADRDSHPSCGQGHLRRLRHSARACRRDRLPPSKSAATDDASHR